MNAIVRTVAIVVVLYMFDLNFSVCVALFVDQLISVAFYHCRSQLKVLFFFSVLCDCVDTMFECSHLMFATCAAETCLSY